MPTLYVADNLSPEVSQYLTQSRNLKPDINILGGDVAVPTDVKAAINKIFKKVRNKGSGEIAGACFTWLERGQEVGTG